MVQILEYFGYDRILNLGITQQGQSFENLEDRVQGSSVLGSQPWTAEVLEQSRSKSLES